MTEKLFESNVYCKKFNAVVESSVMIDGKYGIVLDKTAFFPEGGGQAADEGTINGIPVVDVQQKNNEIVHIIDSEFEIGEEVSCEIDWELRYSRMQNHTGEHIVSGVVNSLYGYDNVGFHMSEKSMTVDFNGSLTLEDVEKIEINANRAIYANADIVAYYPTKEELEKLQYRSKKVIDEGLRIVSIGEDIDCCACCAPHVAKTGEVGVIKILDFYSYKQGTRIEMIAGSDALKDYMNLNAVIKDLMKILSSPRDGVVDSVRDKLKAYQDLSYEYNKKSKRLALCELDLVENNNSVYAVADNLSFDELRYCSNELLEKEYKLCILLSKQGEDGYIYVVSSKSEDVRIIAKQLNETFSGKGGGQKNYSQGKLGNVSEDDIKKFIEKIDW